MGGKQEATAIGLWLELASLPVHPQSVPINMLVSEGSAIVQQCAG